MRKERFYLFLFLALALFPESCARRVPSSDLPLIPLEKANLAAVLEEHEGIEIAWEDAKDVRDFYRGGVQQKAMAEKKFQAKAYQEAMNLYRSSNEFLITLLEYIPEDSAEYTLFEGCAILFLPNLLLGDNHFKMGLISKELGRDIPAQRMWKRALTFVEKSLNDERTEWGLSLQKEIHSLLSGKGR